MRNNSGKVWVVLVGVLVVLLAMALMFFGWYKSGYDKAVGLEESVKGEWGNVDAQLQRRLELVPNLVNTVKGYATHEKDLFENIAKSREKYFAAGTQSEKIAASGELSGMLSRLLMLSENYPELKASENFLALQAQLEGTENRISVARTRYNDLAKVLNSYCRSFFGRFFCKRAGVEKRDYYEASVEAKTTVPEVKF
jgi:LemA protein